MCLKLYRPPKKSFTPVRRLINVLKPKKHFPDLVAIYYSFESISSSHQTFSCYIKFYRRDLTFNKFPIETVPRYSAARSLRRKKNRKILSWCRTFQKKTFRTDLYCVIDSVKCGSWSYAIELGSACFCVILRIGNSFVAFSN